MIKEGGQIPRVKIGEGDDEKAETELHIDVIKERGRLLPGERH